MKHLAKFMACALVVGMWSCKSEEPLPGGDQTPGSEGDVYTSLTLSLPTSTRANTVEPGTDVPAQSDNGFEEGKDYENNVDNIYVVLAEKDEETANSPYIFLTSSLSNSVMNQSKNKPTYTIQFKSDAFNDYDVAHKVYVFAYCNPSSELITAINTLQEAKNANPELKQEFTDLKGVIANGQNPEIAQRSKFLMSNALPESVTIPAYEELKTYNTVANAFPLGTVKVERVACRFDFMSTTISGQPINTYVIKDNVSGLSAAKIEIQSLALMNEAKDFFYLPRTATASANGFAYNNDATICGRETPTNWVISPNEDAKINFANGGDYSAIADKYFFNLTDYTPATYPYTEIASLKEKDNHNTWNPDPDKGEISVDDTDYRIWCYATENTMPGIKAQKYGITTGVMFKGEIKAIDSPDDNADENATHPASIIKAAINAGERLYAWTSDASDQVVSQVTIMLGSATDVWNYANTHNTSNIRAQFVAAVRGGYFKLYDVAKPVDGVDNPITVTPETTEEQIFSSDVKYVEGAVNNTDYKSENNWGFVTYVPTVETDKDGKETNHYYVYYPYWNRHNDNDLVEEMGVMEFATVRNNVYKLKVTNVMQFGLPGDVPPPPPHDDETPEVYFKVSVQVLDWVVRVNNIIL